MVTIISVQLIQLKLIMENKPAGMCKHFRMAVILDRFNAAAAGVGEAPVTAAQA